MTFAGMAASMLGRQLWRWRNHHAYADRGPPRRPRILVDVSEIIRHDSQTGIQRVVRAIWSELNKHFDHGYDALPVYATRARGYCFAPPNFLQGGAGQLGTIPVCALPGDRFLGLDLAAHVLPKHRGQLSAWRANGVSVHLVVYDLLPLQRPDWFSKATSRNFKQWFNTLVQIADQALCISDQVAADLQNMIEGTPANGRLAIDRLKLGADIHASIPSRGYNDLAAVVLDRPPGRPFVLMVGTIEPRKGYNQALAAFDHLWANCADFAPDLVIVGRPGWKTAEIQRRLRSHRFKGQRLHWLPDASDEALDALYAGCNGLFLASLGEGFGLPVIEAGLHGRRALVRDLPVFREKGIPDLLYFSDDKPAALAEKLMDLVRAPQSTQLAHGLPSWAECATDLLTVLGLPHQETNLHAPTPARQVA